MGLAEFLTIVVNIAIFFKEYPLIISVVLLFAYLSRNAWICKFADLFNIKSKKLTKKFDPNTLYTKRPIIEFTPICFVQNQDNVDIFVKSIQDFIDSKILDHIHLITYNFEPLTNVDIYFIRAIEQLVDNVIYDNNGLLVLFIFQRGMEKETLIMEMQNTIKEKIDEAVKQKRIQIDTIQIKMDERQRSRAGNSHV